MIFLGAQMMSLSSLSLCLLIVETSGTENVRVVIYIKVSPGYAFIIGDAITNLLISIRKEHRDFVAVIYSLIIKSDSKNRQLDLIELPTASGH